MRGLPSTSNYKVSHAHNILGQVMAHCVSTVDKQPRHKEEGGCIWEFACICTDSVANQTRPVTSWSRLRCGVAKQDVSYTITLCTYSLSGVDHFHIVSVFIVS